MSGHSDHASCYLELCQLRRLLQPPLRDAEAHASLHHGHFHGPAAAVLLLYFHNGQDQCLRSMCAPTHPPTDPLTHPLTSSPAATAIAPSPAASNTWNVEAASSVSASMSSVKREWRLTTATSRSGRKNCLRFFEVCVRERLRTYVSGGWGYWCYFFGCVRRENAHGRRDTTDISMHV